MSPFGYLFVLAGAFLLRQTVVGRAKEIPNDARDAATALLGADWATFGSVLARRGENVSADSVVTSSGSDGSADTPFNPVQNVSGGVYAGTVRKLGSEAKGYASGGTGPSYYDCSGLLWKAAYILGLYKGARFTTRTFRSIASSWTEEVESPSIGDIVLWERKHMGICIGEDRMYSARSTAKGIGESTISGDSSYFGSQPSYWRIK